MTRITGPFGNAIALTRDQEGRLVGAEGSDGDRVAYQYGATAEDTAGLTRVYEYDEAGRLAGLSHPTTGRQELRFDGRGRLIRRSWADGSQEVREYDDAKREYRRRDVAFALGPGPESGRVDRGSRTDGNRPPGCRGADIGLV